MGLIKYPRKHIYLFFHAKKKRAKTQRKKPWRLSHFAALRDTERPAGTPAFIKLLL
jgi:hypothetical protein